MKSFEITIKEAVLKFDNKEQLQAQLTYALFMCESDVEKEFFGEIQFFLWRDDPKYLLSAMDVYKRASSEHQAMIEHHLEYAGFKFEKDDQ